jgi:hypothetical protein
VTGLVQWTLRPKPDTEILAKEVTRMSVSMAILCLSIKFIILNWLVGRQLVDHFSMPVINIPHHSDIALISLY